jgi:spoIIIJ-associated protein
MSNERHNPERAAMEWVETTAKTVDEAREAALDQLGVGAEDAEFDVLEEPKPGLFGRVRGEARIRARIRPTQARPKQERKRRSKSEKSPTVETEETVRAGDKGSDKDSGAATTADLDPAAEVAPIAAANANGQRAKVRVPSKADQATREGRQPSSKQREQVPVVNDNDAPQSDVSPAEVGAAAVAFMDGLTEAFGVTGASELTVDGTTLQLNVAGSELGLLVGPGGRTLNAVQDLARVAAQRRLGDHETRLRIDIAGYRERREQALVKFSRDVAEQVRASGVARSLEPMTSSDRKVIHDVLNEESGVASRSVGEDPNRRIIVEPA